jgi:hypothetical protein
MVGRRAFRGVGAVMRLPAVLVLAMAASAASAAAAPAASSEDLFNQFGLFGTWASDCAAPASPQNPHVTISQPSPGVIVEDHHLGADYEVNRYSVLAARKLSDTQLAVEVIFQPGSENEEREKLTFIIRGHTRRTVFNQPEGGPVRVKDGIALARGTKTPLLKKCE